MTEWVESAQTSGTEIEVFYLSTVVFGRELIR